MVASGCCSRNLIFSFSLSVSSHIVTVALLLRVATRSDGSLHDPQVLGAKPVGMYNSRHVQDSHTHSTIRVPLHKLVALLDDDGEYKQANFKRERF